MRTNESFDPIEEAKRVLDIEAKCLQAAKENLGSSFAQSIDAIYHSLKSGGKIVVTGVGKSGKVAAKVASTLTSIGAPALFLHASEASHGDLGVVTRNDVFLAFSYSGKSDEILYFLPSLKAKGIKIISIVGNTKSPLAAESDFVIDGSVAQEACPLNLAPTSSTTVALALGDAIAAVLTLRLDLKPDEFALNHPGGALGRRLTLTVESLMKKGDDLPWVLDNAPIDQVIEVSTLKKLGAVLVRNQKNKLVGIITEGDIRRSLKHREKLFSLNASQIMTANPVCVSPQDKAITALELMENRNSQISVLPVYDSFKEECVGLVRLHDLIGRV